MRAGAAAETVERERETSRTGPERQNGVGLQEPACFNHHNKLNEMGFYPRTDLLFCCTDKSGFSC